MAVALEMVVFFGGMIGCFLLFQRMCYEEGMEEDD